MSGLLDELLKRARKRGIEVRFEIVHRGHFTTVRALAGLLSKEATSKKMQVAKYIALQELITEIGNKSNSCLSTSELAKVVIMIIAVANSFRLKLHYKKEMLVVF